MKQEVRKGRYARKRKCPFKMRKSIVAVSCSDDARLDFVRRRRKKRKYISKDKNIYNYL